MQALDKYYAHHDPAYFRQAMVEAQQHAARSAHVQLAALNNIHDTLDTLTHEVAEARRTSAQGLAVQQAILARKLFQDRVEEFVYQFGKMMAAFADAAEEDPPSTQFFLLAGVFATVERDGISTAVIRGRDNKAQFDDCLARGRRLWARLVLHPEVLEAVEWAEAEGRRQAALVAAERDRAEAEQKRQQEAGREKFGTTVGAIILALSKLMPIRNCYLKPHIPDTTLKTVVAAFGIRQEVMPGVGPIRPEDSVLGVFDITVMGGGTEGLVVAATGLYYRNQSAFAGKHKSGPTRVPYDQLVKMTVTQEGTITPLLAFDGRYYLHTYSHGWRTTLFDVATAVRKVVDRFESSWASGRPELALRWFVQREGKDQIGPLSDADLTERVRGGKLRPTDMVRKGGVPGWNPAGTLGWLFPGRRGSG